MDKPNPVTAPVNPYLDGYGLDMDTIRQILATSQLSMATHSNSDPSKSQHDSHSVRRCTVLMMRALRQPTGRAASTTSITTNTTSSTVTSIQPPSQAGSSASRPSALPAVIESPTRRRRGKPESAAAINKKKDIDVWDLTDQIILSMFF